MLSDLVAELAREGARAASLKSLTNAPTSKSAVGILAASLYTPSIAGLSGFEVMYRSFLAFYGLVIPAYAVTCAWPLWRTAAPVRATLWAFAATVTLAAPFYWLAFMERQYVFGLAGVGVVLLGGLASNRLVPKRVARDADVV